MIYNISKYCCFFQLVHVSCSHLSPRLGVKGLTCLQSVIFLKEETHLSRPHGIPRPFFSTDREERSAKTDKATQRWRSIYFRQTDMFLLLLVF